ncbi:hypothetical protein [Lactococcus garvieae]|uniref:hypothetical protein n=1 Tax=Lactococcus garvieae TaxID=1363 RepID=UPI00220F620B|nr:hypothetical protein [Lactococcus garvieae]BDM75648.1 hypothetical protein LGMS210922A_05930 [Lactococcus garvieae]BDW50917.1 hypothetical protein LG21E68_05920 [Lactococcus garvieae]
MSEQKYYVKIKKELQADGLTYADAPIMLTKNRTFDYDFSVDSFTKLELAEIMNGAFYKVKQKPRNITIDQLISDGWDKIIGNDWEWINPLIELVPVEEEK